MTRLLQRDVVACCGREDEMHYLVLFPLLLAASLARGGRNTVAKQSASR